MQSCRLSQSFVGIQTDAETQLECHGQLSGLLAMGSATAADACTPPVTSTGSSRLL